METQEAPFENTPQASEDTEWFPSPAEYSPGFTKERWLKLLNEPSISHPLWIVALAGFYYAGGEGTCAQIGSMFDTSALRIRGLCTNLSKRIYWKTKCPTYIEKKLYWLILFREKRTNAERPDDRVWKLRPELYEALGEFNILRFLLVRSKGGLTQVKPVSPYHLADAPCLDHEDARAGGKTEGD